MRELIVLSDLTLDGETQPTFPVLPLAIKGVGERTPRA
jgi:hypothetical protein